MFFLLLLLTLPHLALLSVFLETAKPLFGLVIQFRSGILLCPVFRPAQLFPHLLCVAVVLFDTGRHCLAPPHEHSITFTYLLNGCVLTR